MAPSSTSLSSLPDAALVRILERLDVKERFATCALVCRRWKQLCFGPDLLAHFHVRLASGTGSGEPLLSRLRALAAWLVVVGGTHVRSLGITVELQGLESDSSSRAEAQTLLGTCCSACPGVTELSIHANVPLLETSWMAGLRSLQQLHLGTSRDLQLMFTLEGLKRLRSLHLGGSRVEWHHSVRLPTTLTALHLRDAGSCRLPVAQLAALPGLQRLLLSAPRAPGADEFRTLSVLTSLTCLHMLGYAFVPESISHLTWLRALRYESCFTDAANAEEASGALVLALPRMQHLTSLVLDNPALDQDVLSAAAGIRSLNRLYASAQWVVLPPGPWQQTVGSLALSHRALLGSIAELAAAAGLEHLCVLSVPDCDEGAAQGRAWEAVWRWAEAAPALKRLTFDVCDTRPVPGGLMAGALRLQRCRPALTVECLADIGRGRLPYHLCVEREDSQQTTASH